VGEIGTGQGNTFTVIGLGVLLVITIIVSFQLGRYPIPAKEVLGISLSRIYPIEQFWTDRMEMFCSIYVYPVSFWLAWWVAVCQRGDGLSGVFQNPMAAPDILGASAGAAFGAALAI